MIVETRAIAASDGAQLWARAEGAGPALLLLHPLGASHAIWAAQAAALAGRFRVIRPDARGHGASDVPPGALGLDRLGQDVCDVLDAFGIATADVCGLSMGGATAQWLGIVAPQRVRRLVLANTAAWAGPASAWAARIAAVRAGGMAAAAPGVIARWFTSGFRARAPAAVEQVRQMLMATDPVGYAAACAALRDLDLRRAAALIAAPTLAIAGQHDAGTTPAQVAALAASIPGARCMVLDAAHVSNVEQETAFTEALQAFFS